MSHKTNTIDHTLKYSRARTRTEHQGTQVRLTTTEISKCFHLRESDKRKKNWFNLL